MLIFVRFGRNLYEQEGEVLFGENSKWREICRDANGRGLYVNMCPEPRTPGKKIILF